MQPQLGFPFLAPGGIPMPAAPPGFMCGVPTTIASVPPPSAPSAPVQEQAERQFGCDICSVVQNASEWRGRSCRACNYDLCEKCAVGKDKCPSGHQLVASVLPPAAPLGAVALPPAGVPAAFPFCAPPGSMPLVMPPLGSMWPPQHFPAASPPPPGPPPPQHQSAAAGTPPVKAPPPQTPPPPAVEEVGLAGAAKKFIRRWGIESRFLPRLEMHLKSKEPHWDKEIQRLDAELEDAKVPQALRSGVLLVTFGDVDENTPLTGGSYAGEGGMSLIMSAKMRQQADQESSPSPDRQSDGNSRAR
mmetsp:Transcript_45625/g.108609  ORF Transcript_45625/g.108609 Transcript_45625/m.108609 type:complete len:302 (-) Transcript_45625:20-925(-)